MCCASNLRDKYLEFSPASGFTLDNPHPSLPSNFFTTQILGGHMIRSSQDLSLGEKEEKERNSRFGKKKQNSPVR